MEWVKAGVPQVRLGVFAKHWAVGRAKTRLAATIGAHTASEAARRFLEVTLSRLESLEAQRVVAYTPSEERGEFEALLGNNPRGWLLVPQPDTPDLGLRMRWFFDQARADGCEAAVLVGSDSPDAPTSEIQRAIDYLVGPGERDRSVFGPTADGGYWLVGSRGEPGPIFDDLPWSTPRLMQETLAALERTGRRRGTDYELVREWYDVDTADDLVALERRVASGLSAGDEVVRLAADARSWLSE